MIQIAWRSHRASERGQQWHFNHEIYAGMGFQISMVNNRRFITFCAGLVLSLKCRAIIVDTS